MKIKHMKNLIYILLSALCLSACTSASSDIPEALPITGTFINLPYQDVRNKYTNPSDLDGTDPQMWSAKVKEMKKMGMEYLIFMSVANEEKAYYPSKLMDWHYPSDRQSPVDAIMEVAAENGMKVFMSTGWAKDQDDNLRDPAIKGRQLEMMEELAGLYGGHQAFYGWYLPVEDCLGPVLTDYAVEAVNALTARARELTPAAKILISPYGIFNSDFHDPRYEEQLSRLEVDIIAYQDEIGCVRERYPLTNLRNNWKKLRAIHDKTGVEMWANCETFAWEKGTNDRSSALVPAPFPRLLSQLSAATAGGAERIVSFIMCGLFDDPSSEYPLGQPEWSAKAYEDYMSWLSGDAFWNLAEDFFVGRRGPAAMEDPDDPQWNVYEPGSHEIMLEGVEDRIIVRMLNCRKDGIVPPSAVSVFTSKDGKEWTLADEKTAPLWVNTGHDAFVDMLVFDNLPKARHMKLTFTSETEVYLEIQ